MIMAEPGLLSDLETPAMDYSYGADELDRIYEVLQDTLIDSGVRTVLLIDLAGAVIANLDDGELSQDIYALAALAAGNFGAVSTMANLLGEDEFSLLFHKGRKAHIHFVKVGKKFLLVSIFGNDIPLGVFRLKAAEAMEKVALLLEEQANR